MDVFVCLAEHANETVSREYLLEQVWAGSGASDDLLTGAVSDLRRILQDDSSDPKFIETVPKRGYRLIGQISLPDGTRTDKGVSRFESITGLVKGKAALVIAAVLLLTFIYTTFDERAVDLARENAPALSVAVLPFVNMSGDPGIEYFSDGLTEEILTLLSRIPELKVIGRTSSFAFKGKNEDLRVIGKMLDVSTILEGSVRTAGDQVRITAQLVRASDGVHIWSEKYDRALNDVFSVQDDIAAAIFDAMQIRVGNRSTRGRPTENTEAYALYLKSRSALHGFDYLEAEEMLLQAIELDPEFAEAHELLAVVYFRQSGGIKEAAEAQTLMGAAATKALSIDPDLVLAQALSQAGNMESWSYASEIAALEKAVREEPNNPELLNALQYDLLGAGYLQESLSIAERLIDLDPLSENSNRRLTDALYAVGRSSEAIAVLELQIQLDIYQATWNLGLIHLAERRDENAIAYFELHEQQIGATDSSWIREFVTHGRDPQTGVAYLDDRIQEMSASVPDDKPGFTWQLGLAEWYLYFGYLDRYFDLILAGELTDSSWTDAEHLIQVGTHFRQLGFTAHPKYFEVARSTGIVDVWEQRGPPDFCEKVNGDWMCQ